MQIFYWFHRQSLLIELNCTSKMVRKWCSNIFSVLILLVRHNHYRWHVTPPTHSDQAAQAPNSTSNATLEGSSSKNNPTYTGYAAPDTKFCTHDKNTRYFKNIDLCEQGRVILAHIKPTMKASRRDLSDVNRLESINGSKTTSKHSSMNNLEKAPNRNFIFHNKIPKAGSTTFYNLLVPLSSMNDFDLIHLVPCFDKDDPQPLQDELYFSKQRPDWDLTQCKHSLQVWTGFDPLIRAVLSRLNGQFRSKLQIWRKS